MRLALLSVLLASSVAAASGQPLVLRDASDAVPAQRLGVDLPGMERGGEGIELLAEPLTNAGPRGRAAWRGATTGLLVGLGIGAAVTAVVALSESCNPGSDYICEWWVVGAAAIPFTAITTATGAIIGAALTQPERVPPPVSAVPRRP